MFEPQTLDMNEKVLKASADIIVGSDVWFYLGIKRETVQSPYKFVSNGMDLPYDLPWWPGSPFNGKDEFCCFANTNTKWDDNVCNLNWYSICESV